MTVWKIRHKEKGLFYQSNKATGSNLSKFGKIYQRKPSLKYIHGYPEDAFELVSFELSSSSSSTRYTLVKDESSHEYAIPVDKVEEFYKWDESNEWGYDGPPYEGEDFDEYRVEGDLTFTNPKGFCHG